MGDVILSFEINDKRIELLYEQSIIKHVQGGVCLGQLKKANTSSNTIYQESKSEKMRLKIHSFSAYLDEFDLMSCGLVRELLITTDVGNFFLQVSSNFLKFTKLMLGSPHILQGLFTQTLLKFISQTIAQITFCISQKVSTQILRSTQHLETGVFLKLHLFIYFCYPLLACTWIFLDILEQEYLAIHED